MSPDAVIILQEIERVYQSLLTEREPTDEEIAAALRRWREVVDPRYERLLDAEVADGADAPVDS